MRMAAVLGLFVSAALAQTPEIRLAPVASGVRNGTDIQHAGDGSGRLFFVQQNGVIHVFKNGRIQERPFLDIQEKTRSNGECGLLGLAFPPGYAEKGYFYVNYTDPRCQNTIVARYRTTADPDAADASSEHILLTQRQPFTNHNAGQLAFGPDGYLYLGFGDGGSARDPQNHGQNPMSWLGKMLRIDVESELGQYRVPVDNPFVNDPRFLPEVWAWGLRNPWRYSFDRETGDLWIADVGQDRAEEINVQPASSRGGENYGWRLMEGLQCLATGCVPPADAVLPVHEYSSRAQQDRSVTGGHVYRGRRFGGLRGTYIYGDYVSGRIWGLRREGARYSNRLLLESRLAISTFGEDEGGELYLADHRGGVIYRVEAAAEPRFTASSVVNAASYEPGTVAGSAVAIFVSGVADSPGINAAGSVPLPRTLGGVRVTVNGREAPLYAVANVSGSEQVNAQIPFESSGDRATIVISRDGMSSQPVDVPLLGVQPGVFTTNGADAIVVRSADNSLVTAARPLGRDELVYFYATGLGPVDNNPGTGNGGPRSPLAATRTLPVVTIGGVSCEVLFAGLAPDFVGVYQINIRAPGGIAAGTRDLVVSSGGAAGRPTRVAIQ